ncbi:hypothetical protein GCM10009530_31800 [Microbispora corallina]|uniref:SCO6045-like C-terminal domain-containing protein n=1 Tax=Microbispora corallina TaxID=83302 RepID=A0ABQ4G0B8_9ACTN|nr:hypothetical protein [Microbispora corallina]GIH40490.1 hypothetical protein Mco01_34900 [Microbispora corallina]
MPERTGDDARASLAAGQAQLLAALVAGGPVPEGFDAERVRVQARSLVAKRSGSVARVAPALARRLGAEFGRLFAEYAATRPKPGEGSRADAAAFADWLAARDAGGI